MAAWDPFSDELEDIIETVELRVRTDVTISFPALTRARSTQGKSCCRASPPPSSRSQPIPTRSRVEVSTVAASIAMELANRKDMGKEDSFTPLALAATPDVREVKPVQCVPTSTVGTGYTSYRKPSRFRRFALDTDIHGMKHLIKRGPIRRTAWVLMLLLSLGLMSFECMESLIYYFEFHHVTKVELQYTNNMTFPAVTICNMNKYRRSALGMRDLATVGPYIGIVDRQQFTLQQEHLYPKAWVDKVKNENLKALSKMTTGQQNFAVFVERVGHQKEDMIVNCEWRGSPCSAKNFTHTFTHLGNCYTFNGMTLSRKVLSSSKPGEGNGLKVTINIENDEYMATNDVAGDAMDAGIKVMVHPQHEPPFVKELGFAVSPGFHTFVAIRKEVITTLPAPYGNCQQRGGQKYYPDYSLSACRIECETEHVVHECGCRLVEMPGEHVPVCTPERYQCAYEKLGIVDRQQFTLQQEHLYPKAWVDKVKNENLKALSKMTTGHQNFAVFVERVGHQKEDMIVNCEWRGSPCSAKNFTHTFTHLGNCYTFNGMTLSRKVLSSSKPGEGNGLKVTINIENDEYMATNDVAGDAMDAGIKVMVHPQHEPPFVKELGFAVSPGFHTFVAIRKEVITTLPAPYGNCQERGGQKYYPDYSLSACRIECETEHVVHECGCRLVEMPVEYVREDFSLLIHYTKTLNLDYLFISLFYSDNIAVLNVYYEALNYESIVQIPAIETEGLLGDLGGQMGLFLGASFLTLVEVFEYLMDELYGRVLKKCCRCKATASAHTTSPSADVLSVNINGSATQLPQTSRA
ncbi:PREDICTED: acid-sensing ion channel 2-like [Branchiostoma belcheri]|uniref:Acid-sensing ion channel 2-like n=1 Tax=Branchiostoma belcheri TaxID=7741 RepID=A0A6P4YXM1_BRABE|nr:PREDICTED: acid-sensing ion channel 2-like [Branchiostoma belcheri]